MAQQLFKFQLWLMASVGWLRLEGTSWGQLLFPPAHARPPRAGYPGGFKTISKDGGSITFLGNLCQCSVTLLEKKSTSRCSEGISCFSVFVPASGLVTNWTTLEGSWFHPACILHSGLYVHLSLLQAEQVLWSGLLEWDASAWIKVQIWPYVSQ